jgi:hypothetical protein
VLKEQLDKDPQIDATPAITGEGSLVVTTGESTGESTEGADAKRGGWTHGWGFPFVVSAILTVLCLPLGSTVPRAGTDPSWQLGLSLIHVRGIAAGPGFVFSYGPLGFLEHPDIVWMRGAALGLGYVVGTTFAFYCLVCRQLRVWLPTAGAVALTAAVAVATVQIGSAGEIATAALVLWAFILVRPEALATPLPAWVPPVLGACAALQLLVKFGAGAMALLAVVIVAAARPPRAKNVALMGASFLASLLVLWVAAGQSLANITQWLRESVQIAVGYGSQMATRPGFDGASYWLWWLVAAAAVGIGCWRLVRKSGVRALPMVILLTAAAFYFTKEGLTRLDHQHAKIAFVCLGALIAAIPWERRWSTVGIVGVALVPFAIIATSGSTGSLASRTRDLVVTHPRQSLGEAERILRSSIESRFRSNELHAARQTIRAWTGVPESVAREFQGDRVHADGSSISSVWAYDLPWRPVPVFQSYVAYSSSLDQLNANSLQSANGPNVVLRRRGLTPVDGRFSVWESPNYMVTLTCNYELAAQGFTFQFLKRTTNVCRPPRFLSQETLSAGRTAGVPSDPSPDDIIVATFDYPGSLGQRIMTTLVKPSSLPTVLIDGSKHRFVTGTATDLHLVRVPDAIGTRRIANGGLDVRNIAFPNAPGSVTVRFYALSAE